MYSEMKNPREIKIAYLATEQLWCLTRPGAHLLTYPYTNLYICPHNLYHRIWQFLNILRKWFIFFNNLFLRRHLEAKKLFDILGRNHRHTLFIVDMALLHFLIRFLIFSSYFSIRDTYIVYVRIMIKYFYNKQIFCTLH